MTLSYPEPYASILQPSLDNSVKIELKVKAQKFDAGWSSLVARRAHNPKVPGSNPGPATKLDERDLW